jgi:quinol monooxygenase YgiN
MITRARTVVLMVRVTVRPGAEDRFEQLIAELRELSVAGEPGLLQYDFLRTAEPSTYVGIEAFVDETAFRDHQVSDHHHQDVEQLRDVIAQQLVEWLTPVPGGGQLRPTNSSSDPSGKL